MKEQESVGGIRDADVQQKTKPKGVSRRAFVEGLSAIGAAAAFLSGSTPNRAKAQYGYPHVDGLADEQLVAMYTDMLKIRLWESKIKDLILQGGFRGVAHLYVGEEAIAVGVCNALRKDDYIASNHRGHGHLIAKGGDLGRPVTPRAKPSPTFAWETRFASFAQKVSPFLRVAPRVFSAAALHATIR